MAPRSMKWVPKGEAGEEAQAEEATAESAAEETKPKGKGKSKDKGEPGGGGTGKEAAGKSGGKGDGGGGKGKEARKGKKGGDEWKGGAGDWKGRKGGDDWKGGGKGKKGGDDWKGGGKGKRGGDDWEGGGKDRKGGKDRRGGDDWKGGKSAGKGGKDRKGGGKDDYSGFAMKTNREVEAEMEAKAAEEEEIVKVRRPKGEAHNKQAEEVQGTHCEVRKHSGMGCAVVSMDSHTKREAVMRLVERKFGAQKIDISGCMVQMKRHMEKGTQREVLTDIFMAWGHKQEKDSPLAGEDIVDFIDKLYTEAQQGTVPPMQSAPGMPLHVPQPSALGKAPPSIPGAVPGAAAYYQQYQMAAAMAARGQFPGYPPQQQAMPNAQYYHQYQAAMAAQQMRVQQLQHMQMLQVQQRHQLQAAQASRMMTMEHDAESQWTAANAAAHESAVAHAAKSAEPSAAAAEGGATQAAIASAHLQAAQAATASAAATAPTGDASARAEASGAPASPSGQRFPHHPDLVIGAPKIYAIKDPTTGKAIDTMNMNFEARRPNTPMEIINPSSGDKVTPAPSPEKTSPEKATP